MHQPFPVRGSTLYFVAWAFQQGLSGGTVKNYLAAVRHSHISLGLGNPGIGGMRQLEYVVKGLKRRAQNSGRTRLPITVEILEALQRVWLLHQEPHNAVMLWAAAAMCCFFGFLRSGEVTIPKEGGFEADRHLAVGDVRLSRYQDLHYVEVHLKASKTDPYRQGVTIFLGRVQSRLCPVSAVARYMVLWSQASSLSSEVAGR